MKSVFEKIASFIKDFRFNLQTKKNIQHVRDSVVSLNIELQMNKNTLRKHDLLIKENSKQIAWRDSNIQKMNEAIKGLQSDLEQMKEPPKQKTKGKK